MAFAAFGLGPVFGDKLFKNPSDVLSIEEVQIIDSLLENFSRFRLF